MKSSDVARFASIEMYIVQLPIDFTLQVYGTQTTQRLAKELPYLFE